MRKGKRSKRIRGIIFILVCLVGIVLIGSSFAMLAEYSRVMHQGAGIIGLIHSDDAAETFRASIDRYRTKSEQFAERLESASVTSVDDLAVNIGLLSKNKQFSEIMFARYFKDGVEYSLSTQPFAADMESKQVIVGARMEVPFCAGIIEDRQYSISAVAYCVPVKHNAFADCVALFYPVDSVIGSVEMKKGDSTRSQITTICSSEGEIASILQNNAFDIQKHNNIYEFLRKQINDKSTIDQVQVLIGEGRSGSFNVKIGGNDCILTVSGIREHGTSPFAVIAIYKAADIYNAAYSTVSTVLGELAIFFVLLIFVAVYFIVMFRASERHIKTLKEYNDMIGCATRIGFEKAAGEIVGRNKSTQFAVVVVDIRHFDYMTEHMGFEQMTEEIKRNRDFFSRTLQLQETFGYGGNGRFLLLLHYRDRAALGERIRTISSRLNVSKVTNSGERILLSPYGGICLAESGLSVEKMIDKAIQAENATKYPFDFESFRIYNEALHSSDAMNEYIEVNMQSALDNNLFKVFYQPKYNLASNMPDGCEALVRWYNPEKDEYMPPAVFLPLFEENRFIIKLDKYVYEQVCIYIANAAAEHKPLYPVSVNVSRITVTDPDFLDFYVATKKKYNIADDFLTIEFTESFAFEDYEHLLEVVNVLHQNGFKCSIDDFGSGYSSYNILKELPMDEIKLDRFFIKKGLSDERDLKVLSSVIQLGKGLKMKVTQEGVETKDQLLMIQKLGCDVIQGYFYSKPLVEHDYDDFLQRKVMI